MKALVLLALVLAVAGCGNRDSVTPGGDNELRGRTFLSTSVTENGQPRQLTEKARVRLQFFDDGRLMADVGCNSMGGPASLDGSKIEVAELAMTGVGCDRARHEQDDWLAKFLGGKPSWRLDGDNLVVSSSSIELVLADREVAEPDLALEGTRWILSGFLDGQVASSMPDAANAMLVFEKGTVEVTTGCNRGSGSYELAGTTIRFSEISTTRMACEGQSMTIENAMLAVLGGEISYEIDANNLTLKAATGKGLQLLGERP